MEQAFLRFCATFYGNLGNYRSFGDSKIVPAVSHATFTTILKVPVALATRGFESPRTELRSICCRPRPASQTPCKAFGTLSATMSLVCRTTWVQRLPRGCGTDGPAA